MNLEQRYDRALDKIITIARRTIELEFDRAWFAWLQWVIVASGVYAVGKKTESLLLMAVGVFSGVFLVCSAWFRTERFLIEHLARAKERPLLFLLIATAASLLPLATMLLLVRLFQRLVQVSP